METGREVGRGVRVTHADRTSHELFGSCTSGDEATVRACARLRADGANPDGAGADVLARRFRAHERIAGQIRAEAEAEMGTLPDIGDGSRCGAMYDGERCRRWKIHGGLHSWELLEHGPVEAKDFSVIRYQDRLRAERETRNVEPGAQAVSGVEHPAHYGGADDPYEAIKVIEAWGLGFHLGNALKYLRRWERKGGVDDLKKARWYLDREIERCESAGRGRPA